MLETMTTIILVVVGVALFLFIMIYGIYITFYPLGKTVKGGIEAMKEYAEQKEKGTMEVPEQVYTRSPAAQLRLAHQEAHKGKD